jgi:hypothetical protein
MDSSQNSKDEIFENHHQSIFIQLTDQAVVDEKENKKNLIEQTKFHELKRDQHFMKTDIKLNDDFLEISFIKKEK